MEWSDQGMLLSLRKHGEGSAIIDVLSQDHGRHAGVVRGGGSRKMAALLQPGAQLALTWRARLEDHLGSFTVEPKFSRSVNIMAGRLEIAAFGAVSGMILACLPEREPQTAIYAQVMGMMDDFPISTNWLASYVRFEMTLLQELGFGLDLSACAASGVKSGLEYVSPKSGRAVSATAAVGWENRLLKLPEFLLDAKITASVLHIRQGLELAGFFLKDAVFAANGRKNLPQARGRFISTLNSDPSFQGFGAQ